MPEKEVGWLQSDLPSQFHQKKFIITHCLHMEPTTGYTAQTDDQPSGHAQYYNNTYSGNTVNPVNTGNMGGGSSMSKTKQWKMFNIITSIIIVVLGM